MANEFSYVIKGILDISDIEKQLNALNKTTQLNKISIKLNKLDFSQVDGDLKLNVENLKKKVESLLTDIKLNVKLDENIDTNLAKKINLVVSEFNYLNSEVQKVNASFDNTFSSNKQKSIADIKKYIDENTLAMKEYKKTLEDIQTRMGKVENTSQLKALNNEFVILRKEIDAAGKSGRTFSDELSNDIKKFGTWLSAGTIFMKSINGAKEAFNTIIELDDAMVELKKVTDETDESYTNFYYTANDIAKSLGQTTNAVIETTAAFAQMGYALEEASELAKSASIFATISPEMSSDEATQGMISVIKAYKIKASDALDEVGSKINKTGNEFALTNSDIVTGLEDSASALQVANNSLDEAISLITAGTEITRNASRMGNALRTISMRIRGNFIGQPLFVW